MRTTLDIDDDILAVAKEMARTQCVSAGRVISRLLRDAMTGQSSIKQTPQAQKTVAGFAPFPSQGILISNADIDALRDVEGV
ncbi:MAG: hypothetical protein ACOYNF_02910 [Rhodoferax sp.]